MPVSNLKLAVQLWSLRDDLASDFPQALDAIRRVGLHYVELAGLHGHQPAEVHQMLGDQHLLAIGGHYGLDRLEDDLAGVVEEARILGFRHVVVPWVPKEAYADGWRMLAMRIEVLAQKLREASLHLSYHNHDFEFEEAEGSTGFDLLFESTDPRFVGAEIDAYWAAKAGHDPVRLIRKCSGRVPLVHFKDISPSGENAPCGSGILQWDALLLACDESGVEYGVIEMDTPVKDPISDLRASTEFLRSIGISR